MASPDIVSSIKHPKYFTSECCCLNQCIVYAVSHEKFYPLFLSITFYLILEFISTENYNIKNISLLWGKHRMCPNKLKKTMENEHLYKLCRSTRWYQSLSCENNSNKSESYFQNMAEVSLIYLKFNLSNEKYSHILNEILITLYVYMYICI